MKRIQAFEIKCTKKIFNILDIQNCHPFNRIKGPNLFNKSTLIYTHEKTIIERKMGGGESEIQEEDRSGTLATGRKMTSWR